MRARIIRSAIVFVVLAGVFCAALLTGANSVDPQIVVVGIVLSALFAYVLASNSLERR